MDDKAHYIAPIAIDLGAKNTGVYSALYPAGSSPKDIKRYGTVYTLEKDKYTILMKSRTAKRHQRRGFDRKQMAKRLFKLIWEKEFNLDWNDDVAQSVGFLFNRRGFSFLVEEYDPDSLKSFPQEAWSKLPSSFISFLNTELEDFSIQDICIDGQYDINILLEQLIEQKKLSIALEKLTEKQQKVKKDLVFFRKNTLLKKHLTSVPSSEDATKKELRNVSRWIVEQWISEEIFSADILPERGAVDVQDYIAIQNKNGMKFDEQKISDYKEEKKSAKDNIWNFDIEKFEIEKLELTRSDSKDSESEQNSYLMTTLQHLCYAFHVTHNEIISGARPRSEYFKEISDILAKKDHGHGYLRRFCEKLHSGTYGRLKPEILSSLISHISNFELRLLRKYFNSQEHRTGDVWKSEWLHRYFKNWILKEWRVDPTKDKQKKKDGKQCYERLREEWKKRGGNIIDFFCHSDPQLTIPPYQNNNNRRPPHCQSLILDVNVLQEKYPQWVGWLESLQSTLQTMNDDYLGDFQQELVALSSSKGRPYYSLNNNNEQSHHPYTRTLQHLNARALHLILDRVKKQDPFKLNEIYSHAKKIRQLKQQIKQQVEQSNAEISKVEEKLKLALNASSLPSQLKSAPNYHSDDIFAPATFLHFICSYYRFRQRARDSRLFIHPEYKHSNKRGYQKTSQFHNTDFLLTYCNDKPRLKKYQSFHDFAAILQVTPKLLEQKIGSKEDVKIIEWAADVKGLKSCCAACSKAQKDHRGMLKLHLNTEKSLISLSIKCKKLSVELAQRLVDSNEDAVAKKFESVFSFAQIYNILFVDRKGNSNTCPVCSLDNSYRMNSQDGVEARAQRLPAIPTRIIDGAVMKMTAILSKRIVADRWGDVEEKLMKGASVCIPIITESNRFEFEPSLYELKGKRMKNKIIDTAITDKKKRIEDASPMCPYSGVAIHNGQIDHIIPRASRWGTLNDEANLIYATEDANKRKDAAIYHLNNLNETYKKEVFREHIATEINDKTIEEWIQDTIWNTETEDFSFGRYRNFINLSKKEQLAFRHALFLNDDSPVKKSVIDAINSRVRTLVNGTQRYFAEVLANEFHKQARSLGNDVARRLSFDYYAVEANSNSRGRGVQDFWFHFRNSIAREANFSSRGEGVQNWRKIFASYPLEKLSNKGVDLQQYDKKDNTKQKAYSHLIDAQIAFFITAKNHRNEGGLRLNIPNTDNDVPLDELFTDIFLHPDHMRQIDVLRRKPSVGFTQHRSFTRDTMYADHYLPILMAKEKDSIIVRVGFSWKNSALWISSKEPKKIEKNVLLLKKLLPFCKQIEDKNIDFVSLEKLYEELIQKELFQKQLQQQKYIYCSIDKQVLHRYWVEKHNTATGVSCDDFFKFCYKDLCYRSKREQIEKEDDINKNINNEKKFMIEFKDQNIILPCKHSWERLKEAWEAQKTKEDINFQSFLKKYFQHTAASPMRHQKTRKVFSLPIKTTDGKFLLQRNSWTGRGVFQILEDSNSRSINNKPITPAISSAGFAKKGQLNPWARSKNFVKLEKIDLGQESIPIDPEKWFPIMENPYPEYIEEIYIRVDDTTRPSLWLTLKDVVITEDIAKELLDTPLIQCKDEEVEKTLKIFAAGERRIQYKGSRYNTSIQNALNDALQKHETSGN